MSSASQVRGTCYCGVIRFAVDLPVKWVAHCHCDICKQIHGAPVTTWVGSEADRFHLLAGTEQLTWYASTEAGERARCQTCGTQLFFRSPRWPDEIHITRTSFRGPVGKEPGGHAYFDRHVDWLNLGDELPRFGGPSGNEPLDT